MKRTVCNIYAILLTGIIPVLLSCGSTTASSEKEGETEIELSNVNITTVVTESAANKNFSYFIHANGKIRSLREQTIAAESGGRLLKYHARTGMLVHAGSLLAQLETTHIQHRLERAQLTRFNSEKEYEGQLLGYENLLKDKTAAEAEAIKQKLRISTGLAGAEQEIREAKYEISKTSIEAPFTGVLADLSAQEGELLKPGHQLFKIYDPNDLLLEVMVLEADVSLLKKGMPAAISAVSMPDVKYAATLHEINPYVDENGMVLVRLKVLNSYKRGDPLFPGMNCTAEIEIPMHKAVVVPKEAVVMRSGKTVVFTYENGKAKWNYVLTGRDNGKEIEIKEGVKHGMKVITTNNLQLTHDAPVQESAVLSKRNE